MFLLVLLIAGVGIVALTFLDLEWYLSVLIGLVFLALLITVAITAPKYLGNKSMNYYKERERDFEKIKQKVDSQYFAPKGITSDMGKYGSFLRLNYDG